jgi:DNA-binding NarL/FixJ family response regulator
MTTGSVDDQLVESARAAGVAALVNKERSSEDLVSRALAVLSGRARWKAD